MMEQNSSVKQNTTISGVPDRCVIIMDKELTGGLLANAIAVIALTVGQRHPILVGEPLVDATGFEHPGFIPIGIPMLCTEQEELKQMRAAALEKGCDVVAFPMQGQQTKNYLEFQEMTAQIETNDLQYTGIAIIGIKKVVGKIVRKLDMM